MWPFWLRIVASYPLLNPGDAQYQIDYVPHSALGPRLEQGLWSHMPYGCSCSLAQGGGFAGWGVGDLRAGLWGSPALHVTAPCAHARGPRGQVMGNGGWAP